MYVSHVSSSSIRNATRITPPTTPTALQSPPEARADQRTTHNAALSHTHPINHCRTQPALTHHTGSSAPQRSTAHTTRRHISISSTPSHQPSIPSSLAVRDNGSPPIDQSSCPTAHISFIVLAALTRST